MSHIDLKVLVLAAGFGTRLKEYGEKVPKGLIPFQNTTLVGHVITELNKANVSTISLITNAKYLSAYKIWDSQNNPSLKIINDGATEPSNRKGAIGDILFATQCLDWLNDNVLVVPSDTYFEFSLAAFIQQAVSKPDSFCTVVRQMSRDSIANRLGCAVLNEHNQINSFIEKPENPPSDYAAIPFYYYPKSVLNLLQQYQSEGNSMDAPGSIIPWLIKKNIPVYAHIVNQPTIDVGTINEVNLLQSKNSATVV